MKLKEFIMVVCRNAGRCFGVANRSDFYHDFLRSLYDKGDYPAFYDNKVACLVYYTQLLGHLPKMQVNDESKGEHYLLLRSGSRFNRVHNDKESNHEYVQFRK